MGRFKNSRWKTLYEEFFGFFFTRGNLWDEKVRRDCWMGLVGWRTPSIGLTGLEKDMSTCWKRVRRWSSSNGESSPSRRKWGGGDTTLGGGCTWALRATRRPLARSQERSSRGKTRSEAIAAVSPLPSPRRRRVGGGRAAGPRPGTSSRRGRWTRACGWRRA